METKILIDPSLLPLAAAFAQGLLRALGPNLHAAYLHGSITFPNAAPPRDLDFHVILNNPPSEAQKSNLYALHAQLARDFPPLGSEMDGYYILLADARHSTPPRNQLWHQPIDDAWALHRQHLRAGRHMTLHGPDPKQIVPAPTWPEIERALAGELHFVESHLDQSPDYCVLQLCRLIYSHQTKDVVISKSAAADWALAQYAQWQKHIALARQSYAHETRAEDLDFLRSELPAFVNFARTQIPKG